MTVTMFRMMTPAETSSFRILDEEWQHGEILRQIGTMNVMAISGLRWSRRPTGITLPAGRGYEVHVDLAANDTYTVRRVLRRGDGAAVIVGEESGVYCEQVGDSAYRASCWASAEFPAR
jgi:hypothetical protein